MVAYISLDVESTGLDVFHGAKPYFVTACTPNGKVRYWEWCVNPRTRQPEPSEEDLWEIRQLIDDDDNELVLHNAKFDVSMLKTVIPDLVWPWHRTHDTARLAHMLHSSQKLNLTDLAMDHLGYDILPFEKRLEKWVKKARDYIRRRRDTFKEWSLAEEGRPDMPSAGDKLWKSDAWVCKALAPHHDDDSDGENAFDDPDHPFWHCLRDYANADSPATIGIFTKMIREIESQRLNKIYAEIRKVNRIAHEMEQRGVTINADAHKRLTVAYRCESEDAEAVCVNIASDYGYDLTLPRSGRNESLFNFMFDTLKLPVVKKTDKGNPSMDATAMEQWLLELEPGTKPRLFVQSLMDKRKRDKALEALANYERFWLPWEPCDLEPLPCQEGCEKNKLYANWRRLHPQLNPTGTAHLRWSSQNPNEQNCSFSAETEVLTLSGWVRADELTEDHRIAQYWKGGQIDFVRPEVIKYHFKGQMQHIWTDQKIDMLLTPNHRCLIRDRKTLALRDKRADQFPKDAHHFQAGNYVGGDTNFSEDVVTWLCAVQADGSYVAGGGITFAFKKERKITRLRTCLQRLGALYSESVWDSGHTRLYVGKGQELVNLAKDLMPDKVFGPWLLNCNAETLQRFCKEFMLWDGDSSRNRVYTSSRKENADWVQTIYSLCGHRAWQRYVDFSDGRQRHYYVNVTFDVDYSMTANHTREQIEWDDYVYCVSVPSTYVLIRRDGKVSVTGNSKKEGFNLRQCFGPAPGREWYSLDAQNIELRIPAFEAEERELMDVFLRPKDPPYFGSYHLVVFALLHPELFAKDGVKCKDLYKSTWYQWVKNFNFALIYGAGKKKADLTARVEGAYDMVRHRFPKIAQLADRQIRQARIEGYVYTIPDKTVDPDRGYPLMIQRNERHEPSPTQPLNYHVSGTACWWMAKAMIKVQDFFDHLNSGSVFMGKKWPGGYHLVMQVHDELVPDMPSGKGKGKNPWDYNMPVVQEMRRLMESCGDDIGVPTPVAVEYNPVDWSTGVKL